MHRLRKIFPKEDKDFTKWLSDNLSKLKPFTESEIISYEIEKKIEGKSLDILAIDQEGRKVAIENQFGTSDFEHLGKIISYCVSLKADKGIWIAENFHPICIGALQWLNSVNSSIKFLPISVVNPLNNELGDRDKIEFRDYLLINDMNIGDEMYTHDGKKVEIDDKLKELNDSYNDKFPRSRAVYAGQITGQFINWLFKRDKEIYEHYFKKTILNS